MFLEWFMVLLGWTSVVVFLGVAVVKIVRVARSPLGVRWEVYPVPHESGDRRHYGGSYMEDVDWAATYHKPSLLATLIPELLEIGSEVVLLKRVRAHNRYGIWPLSMCMHWGIYLTLTWVGLLVTDVVAANFTAVTVFSQLAFFVGPIAFLLGAFGSLALVVRRATSRELSLYTAPVDFANLFFLFVIFAAGLLGVAADGAFLAHSRSYVQGVLTLSPVSVPFVALLPFLLLELFFIYMPFSKLIHYIAKYFTFHQALWDDGFKLAGDGTDRQLLKQLSYMVTWSGPHIVPGKTWLEEVQMTATGEAGKK
jgi:nitrate reductase gamma subunit